MRSSIILLVTVLLAGIFLQNAASEKLTLAEVRENIKPLKKVCMQKSGASKESVEAIEKGPDVPVPSDKKYQCYQRCILTSTKGLKDGELREKVMLRQVELMLVDDIVDKVSSIISNCIKQATSTDPCEVSWQFMKCYYETGWEYRLL